MLKLAIQVTPDWPQFRRFDNIAVTSKRAAITDITPLISRGPPATPTPTIGPLFVCIMITNNGATTTETAVVTDPGAAGFPGTVNFNGQGLNVTSPFTFGPNATADVPFVVGVLGNSTITTKVTEPSGVVQTDSFVYLLDGPGDQTSTACKR